LNPKPDLETSEQLITWNRADELMKAVLPGSETEKNINIVIVEPDPSAFSDLESRLAQAGYSSCISVLPGVPIHQLDQLSPDLAIMGPSLGLQGATRCVHKLKIIDRTLPILIMKENGPPVEEPIPPFDGIFSLGRDTGPETMAEAIEAAFKRRLECKSHPDLTVLIGKSEGIRKVREQIDRICGKDVHVLITGESGTGKELIARAIHYNSARSSGPLVKINCGALPDDLLESEVFGFQKGAFTGAHKNKPGRLELADGGTLFIDEIGDLSLSLQVKFLQVLEDKAFSRLGGTEDKIVDTRVVAATNADLRKKIAQGTFRKDLFYRLNIVHIEACSLRERKDDIPLLVYYFLEKYCYELKKEGLEISEEALEHFLAYHWPGNVRELENVVRRAIVMRNWDFAFTDLLLEKGGGGGDPFKNDPNPVWPDDKVLQLFKENEYSLKRISKAYVSEMEREAILEALRETHWNRKKAAEVLQVSYKTLLNRILEFDLKP
jgi:two-component system, NtrC family, response regulator AtoC